MSKVKCVVLVSGLELMGELEERAESIILKDVVQVALVPSGGRMGHAIIPWLPYAEKSEFSFTVDNILTIFSPAVEILNNYNQIMGSGIQIATASSLN